MVPRQIIPRLILSYQYMPAKTSTETNVRDPGLFEYILETVFWLLHEYLSLPAINCLACVNRKLKVLCGAPGVFEKHSNEYVQAGDEILHLSSVLGGLKKYTCTVLEVFTDRIDTTFMIRTLRDTDRIGKIGWPFFRFLYV